MTRDERNSKTYHPALRAPLLPEGGEICVRFSSFWKEEYPSLGEGEVVGL
jgi:hypothetical protein